MTANGRFPFSDCPELLRCAAWSLSLLKSPIVTAGSVGPVSQPPGTGWFSTGCGDLMKLQRMDLVVPPGSSEAVSWISWDPSAPRARTSFSFKVVPSQTSIRKISAASVLSTPAFGVPLTSAKWMLGASTVSGVLGLLIHLSSCCRCHLGLLATLW